MLSSYLLSLFAAAVSVQAQQAGVLAGGFTDGITVKADNLVQCAQASISWTGGKPPYTLTIGTGGYYIGVDELESHGGLTGNSYNDYTVTQKAGTEMFFMIEEGGGGRGYIQNLAVKSGDGGCLGESSSASSSADSSSTSPASSAAASAAPSSAPSSAAEAPASSAAPVVSAAPASSAAPSSAAASSAASSAAAVASSSSASAAGVVIVTETASSSTAAASSAASSSDAASASAPTTISQAAGTSTITVPAPSLRAASSSGAGAGAAAAGASALPSGAASRLSTTGFAGSLACMAAALFL